MLRLSSRRCEAATCNEEREDKHKQAHTKAKTSKETEAETNETIEGKMSQPTARQPKQTHSEIKANRTHRDDDMLT